MSDYQSYDRWHTSPAERARNECGDAIHSIEDAIQSIRSDIALLSGVVEGDLPKYRGSNAGDASQGLFATDFELALDRWKTAADSLIGLYGALNWAANDLEVKLTLMRSRKAYLDRLCAIEDEREYEYQEWEIPH